MDRRTKIMNYTCKITEEQDMPFLKIRTRTPVEELPVVLGKYFGQIIAYMHETSIKMSGAPFVAYYNMDMSDLEIDVCVPVAVETKGNGNILADKLGRGNYVSTLHIGPYHQVEGAYKAITEYIQVNNIDITGVAYEFYLNDPQEVKEEELQTQVMFKIQ
jgi:effector-binding domain-containing protein